MFFRLKKLFGFRLIIGLENTGISIGGEYPAVICYLFEKSNQNNRSFYSSFANVTTVAGVLLGSLVTYFIEIFFSRGQIDSYAWRIPFIISAASVLLGFYLRVKLTESEIFLSHRKKLREKITVIPFIKKEYFEMLKLFGLIICVSVTYYIFNIFNTTYFSIFLGFDQSQSLRIATTGTLTLIVTIPIFGFLCDKVGSSVMLFISLFGLIVCIVPIYHLFLSHNASYAILAQLCFAIFLAVYLAALPSVLANHFSIATRCLAIAIPYNLCLATFGGTAPTVNIYLLNHFHTLIAPAYYIMATACISLLSLLFLKVGRKVHAFK